MDEREICERRLVAGRESLEAVEVQRVIKEFLEEERDMVLRMEAEIARQVIEKMQEKCRECPLKRDGLRSPGG